MDQPLDASTAPTTSDARQIDFEVLRVAAECLARECGPNAAVDAMFRVGRTWGERFATPALRNAVDSRTVLTAELERMATLGLEPVGVSEFVYRPEDGFLRLVGTIGTPLPPSGDGHYDASRCGLAVGFLAGLLGRSTGLDLRTGPWPCQQSCDTCRGHFEITSRASALTPRSTNGDDANHPTHFVLGAFELGPGDTHLSLDELLETTSDAIILLDDGNIVRFWNRGAEEMFQITRAEALGRRAGFILPPDLLASDELGQIQRKLELGEEVRNFVTRRMRKDGTILWVSVTRTLLRDQDGGVRGSTAVIRDITDQRRNEEALARSKTYAILGELAAKIAHEMKNPLAGIYAAAQVLARDLHVDDPRRKVLENIQREIRRLDDTVVELLQFARPLPPRRHSVELRHFVEDSITSLRSQFAPHKVEIVVQVPEALFLEFDSRLMAQVLTNLVINAAQAIGENGKVEVLARRVGAEAEIEVRDSGPGLKPEVLAHLFEPFYTTKTRGTGLGLAIARKNVEAHGGTLEAGNRPGGGARFVMRIPATPRDGA